MRVARPKTVRVPMNSRMKGASAPDTLVTEGMSPCIAIAIYDSDGKSGYMVHSPYHRRLKEQLDGVRKDRGDLSRAAAVVFGSASSSGDSEKDRMVQSHFRAQVMTALRMYFSDPQIWVKWLATDMYGDLSLDLSSGVFTALEVPLGISDNRPSLEHNLRWSGTSFLSPS